MYYNEKPIQRDYLSTYLTLCTDYTDQLFDVIYSNAKLQQKLDESNTISESSEEAKETLQKLTTMCEFFKKMKHFHFSLINEILQNLKNFYGEKEKDGYETSMLEKFHLVIQKLNENEVEELAEDLKLLFYALRRE